MTPTTIFEVLEPTPKVPFPPTEASASHRPSMARVPVATSTMESVKLPPAVGVAVASAPALMSAAASLMIDLSASESGKYPLVVFGSVRAMIDVLASTADTTAVADNRREKIGAAEAAPASSRLRRDAPGGRAIAGRAGIQWLRALGGTGCTLALLFGVRQQGVHKTSAKTHHCEIRFCSGPQR